MQSIRAHQAYDLSGTGSCLHTQKKREDNTVFVAPPSLQSN